MKHELPSSINSYLIKDIVDVRIPEKSISWFPQTIGWQIILLIIIGYFLYLGYKKYKFYQSNRYRREAQKAIALIEKNKTSHQARQFFYVMKTVATHLDPKIAIATGTPILEFFDQHLAKKENYFNNDLGQKWQSYILDPKSENQLSEQQLTKLADHCRYWIINHQKDRKAS